MQRVQLCRQLTWLQLLAITGRWEFCGWLELTWDWGVENRLGEGITCGSWEAFSLALDAVDDDLTWWDELMLYRCETSDDGACDECHNASAIRFWCPDSHSRAEEFSSIGLSQPLRGTDSMVVPWSWKASASRLQTLKLIPYCCLIMVLISSSVRSLDVSRAKFWVWWAESYGHGSFYALYWDLRLRLFFRRNFIVTSLCRMRLRSSPHHVPFCPFSKARVKVYGLNLFATTFDSREKSGTYL